MEEEGEVLPFQQSGKEKGGGSPSSSSFLFVAAFVCVSRGRKEGGGKCWLGFSGLSLGARQRLIYAFARSAASLHSGVRGGGEVAVCSKLPREKIREEAKQNLLRPKRRRRRGSLRRRLEEEGKQFGGGHGRKEEEEGREEEAEVSGMAVSP